MEKSQFDTGEQCPEDGTYQCQMSQEVQKYKKGDLFDYCPMGKRTTWKKIQ